MTTPFVKEQTKADGNLINSRTFHPQGEAKAVIVICNAIGTHQNYYRAFAEWLTSKGYIVITFDFSGIGHLGKNEIKHRDINLMTWVKHDCKAAIDQAIKLANDKPIYWIGHSFGGQILGYIENHQAISKAIFVASGSGYWKHETLSMKLKALFFWFVVSPISLKLFPYFPGKKLGLIGDMPNGALMQWREWCLNPNYVYGAIENSQAAYDSVKIPIYSIHITDDAMIPKSATDALLKYYRNADVTQIAASPKTAGLNKIGHLGFFNTKYNPALWEKYIDPLL